MFFFNTVAFMNLHFGRIIHPIILNIININQMKVIFYLNSAEVNKKNKSFSKFMRIGKANKY